MHAACVGFEQACEEFGERSLACAVLTYQPYELAGAHFKGEVVYCSSAQGVGKINMFECDHGLLCCRRPGRVGRGRGEALRVVRGVSHCALDKRLRFVDGKARRRLRTDFLVCKAV
ncbi:unknown [Collinsella sp. CAG:289]|nr:unknown [Collinsella sp. CAG:289]